MGFFDSSSSSSTENKTDNSNIGATGSGVALRDSTLTLTDPGTIDLAKKSLDVVGATLVSTTGKALDYGAASQASAFDFLKSSFEKSLAFTGDVVGKQASDTAKTLERFQSSADTSLKEFAALATEGNKQSVQQLTENVFKYGAWLLVGLAVAGSLYAYASRTPH